MNGKIYANELFEKLLDTCELKILEVILQENVDEEEKIKKLLEMKPHV